MTMQMAASLQASEEVILVVEVELLSHTLQNLGHANCARGFSQSSGDTEMHMGSSTHPVVVEVDCVVVVFGIF